MSHLIFALLFSMSGAEARGGVTTARPASWAVQQQQQEQIQQVWAYLKRLENQRTAENRRLQTKLQEMQANIGRLQAAQRQARSRNAGYGPNGGAGQ